MNKIINYTFTFVLLLTSCFGLSEEHLIGEYYLTKMDYANENLDLSYKLEETGNYLGVVEPLVFAIGYNEDYIIIKQYPSTFGKSIDKSVINYFIIPIKNKINKWPDENKIGPLTKDEFLLKRKELKIPDDLSFNNVPEF